MTGKRRSSRRRLQHVAVVTMGVALAGCSAGEAAVDGVYGGISDTIAAIVSNLLLGMLG